MKSAYDLVAIGGGTAGLVSAAGAAYLGLKAAIVERFPPDERHALGGDCLWTGCVPSKALIASARLARRMRNAQELGLKGASPAHAFREAMARMRRARNEVAKHDDPERFRKMGVDVLYGRACFASGGAVELSGGERISGRRFVIATGATPSVPPILRRAGVDYWTYENVFDQDELPASIIILGAGPIGLEFAQVFSRLGSRVTVLEAAPEILTREDPQAASLMRKLLEEEGIDVRVGAAAELIEPAEGGARVRLQGGEELRAERVFAATGRRPAADGMRLDAAGVRASGSAPVLDAGLRTSNRRIWAAGDATGGPQFTHAAEHMAKTVLRNAFFPGRAKISYADLPRVTYTDPEVAHVGESHEDAAARGGGEYRYDLSNLDRAICDGVNRGFVRVSADRKGRILAATIVAHGAGDLLMPFVLAKRHGLSLSAVASAIFPYPTMVECVKRAANEYNRTRLDGFAGGVAKRVAKWMR